MRLGIADRAAAGEAEAEAAFGEIVAACRAALPEANADTIESLDINPFLVRPEGALVLALDAALVLRPAAAPWPGYITHFRREGAETARWLAARTERRGRRSRHWRLRAVEAP